MIAAADGAPKDIDVLVVGDANPDLILRGDVVARFGQAEQLLDSAELVLGGSAAIVACGCARLGLRTQLVAQIGADPFGEFVRAQMSAAGVNLDGLRVSQAEPTGLSVILSTVGAGSHVDVERSILTHPGAVARLAASDVSDLDLARARHLHAASFFLQPRLAAGLAELFDRARALGVSTSLDCNFDPAGQWAGLAQVLARTDYFLPNALELRAVAARYRGTTADASLAAAAAALVELGPLVAVKDGANGASATWVDPDGQVRAVSVPAPDGLPGTVRDTTGAGDSFDAGFLYGRLRAMSIVDSLRAGVAAGTFSTRAAGGVAGQADAAQLVAALDRRMS